MASVSMGNGKAVLALLAIVTVIAACLLQPSLAAASVSVPMRIVTQMVIHSRLLSFASRRCVNFTAMPASVRTQVEVLWHQRSDAGSAECRAIRIFQDSHCKGQMLDVFAMGRKSAKYISGAAKSALCIIAQFVALHSARVGGCLISAFPFPPFALRCAADDICQYVRCPANSIACSPTTDDRLAVTCQCFKGYTAVSNTCQRSAHLPSLSLPVLQNPRASLQAALPTPSVANAPEATKWSACASRATVHSVASASPQQNSTPPQHLPMTFQKL
ncbi:unnamed protein product [Closterium sp. NIES-64]|nr:unnamed protein product [Closterium sp. NIES-64]CAI5975322.1 unnamed protein product [Closterium sp. NIES-64]CAI5975324.1 unnamed protein product [Closterium sp. NIES-64]CAI6005675.1 unnamed protein product [Closterium sp. NIES-64]